MKKAIIFDLDNTIYSVASIGDTLFAPLFKLIKESSEFEGELEAVKRDIMRIPFQVVAKTYLFSENLIIKGLQLLQSTEVTGIIEPFADYGLTKNLLQHKYLVTTGFRLLQESKVRGMHLKNDFREIHIVDPQTSTLTKKDVFMDILTRNDYAVTEVLVVGDDPASEIKAAIELNIDAILYDKFNLHLGLSIPTIKHYSQLKTYL